jgi:hypothetical protein
MFSVNVSIVGDDSTEFVSSVRGLMDYRTWDEIFVPVRHLSPMGSLAEAALPRRIVAEHT